MRFGQAVVLCVMLSTLIQRDVRLGAEHFSARSAGTWMLWLALSFVLWRGEQLAHAWLRSGDNKHR